MKSRNRIHLIIVIAFLLCSGKYGFGQEENVEKVNFNKNAIYGSIGRIGSIAGASLLDSYSGWTGTYERMIKQKMWGKNISSFVRVGFGKTSLDGKSWFGGKDYHREGKLIYTQYGVFFGGNNHHLELGLGIAHYVNGYWESDGILPSTTVGYRYQKPGGNVIFRMGGSFPELFYIGLGLSF